MVSHSHPSPWCTAGYGGIVARPAVTFIGFSLGGAMGQIPASAKAPDRSRSLLGRATSVLQAFTVQDVGLSLSELSRRTDIPKGSLHRIVGQLADRGMLERDGEGNYHLGLALFELARLVPVQRRLREVALPFMADLYQATRETVHLGVLADLDVVYIDRIAGHRQVNVPTRVGGRMPAYCTGLGKAMLAFSEPAVVDAAIERGLAPLSPKTICRPEILRGELQRIRAEGVAFDRQECVDGIVCVAAPVVSKGRPIAALSITGPLGRLKTERFAGAVSVASAGVSRTLSRYSLPR